MNNGKKKGRGCSVPSESELAQRFLERHRHDLCRRDDGTRYTYRGGYWHELVEPRVEGLAFGVLEEAAEEGVNPSISLAQSIKAYAKTRLGVANEMFGRVTNNIVLKNGVLNLDTYELDPHDPGLYATASLPYDYDADAKAPM